VAIEIATRLSVPSHDRLDRSARDASAATPGAWQPASSVLALEASWRLGHGVAVATSPALAKPKKGRFVLLFGLALMLHISLPLLRDVAVLSTVLGVVYILVLSYAGWLTIAGRRARIAYATVLSISVATTIAVTVSEFHPNYLVWIGAHFGFFSFVTARVVLWTVRREHVTIDTIFAALSGYYLLGFSWALLYTLVDSIAPGSFSAPLGPDLSASTYFSFATITTLGYGDISPIAPLPRALATTEALVGQVYMAVLIARLVSQYIVDAKR
jgi:hypothetical protein